jgi:hypothetical protein
VNVTFSRVSIENVCCVSPANTARRPKNAVAAGSLNAVTYCAATSARDQAGAIENWMLLRGR